ncbi:MOP flippase family protein [Halalkalibaculum sp. DA384]|uniref:MOP flippase family protein n=1 Tax=Halalkalibaculum sp. DA384 TaxID=3373606 RepID=UPI003754AF62
MSLRDKSISGVKWTTVSTIVVALASLLKVSVLARFLSAGAFGLMALVNFVLGFMKLFMDAGLTTAILHKQDITLKEYASLYWINVLISLALFIAVTLSSSLIAGFYEEPELSTLIPLMSLSIVFAALGNQFKTIEQKQLNFRYLAFVDISAALVSLVLGIILAIKGFGVYSLVYAGLAKFAVSYIVYFVKGFNDHGMIFYFSYNKARPFLGIGIYQVGGQIVNYFNKNLEVLLIGKFLGSDALGAYDLAKQLVKRPKSILNPVITKVASPVLSFVQNDKVQLKNKFLKFLNFVSTANFTVYILIALFAYPIVYFVYGPDFLNIVFVVQVLCLYMYLRSIGNPIGSLVVATGRTDVEFYWNLFVLSIVPIPIFIGAQFSIEVVAISLTFLMVLLSILSWKYLVNKLSNASFKEYILSLRPRWQRIYKIVLSEISK